MVVAMLRIVMTPAMVLIRVRGPEMSRIAGMRPTMVMMVRAHISVGVTNGDIADVKGDTDRGIGRTETCE
jgi:hypothetical protein